MTYCLSIFLRMDGADTPLRPRSQPGASYFVTYLVNANLDLYRLSFTAGDSILNGRWLAVLRPCMRDLV